MASFFLEFVLLPMRIMSVYITIYYLLPRFLIKREYARFFLSYILLILLAAVIQRVFIYLFYDTILQGNTDQSLFSFKMVLRAFILVNSTVFFVLSIKIFQLFLTEREKNEQKASEYLELKADRRLHRISMDEILYIEGQGNYTTYHLSNRSKITAYGSIKKALESLPNYFIRVHKSYIVNKREIKSFDSNTIEIKDHLVPRGKSMQDDRLLLK